MLRRVDRWRRIDSVGGGPTAFPHRLRSFLLVLLIMLNSSAHVDKLECKLAIS